jgi:hypothetical protein
MSRTGRVRPALPLAMAQPTSGDRVWLSWRGWDGRGRGRTDGRTRGGYELETNERGHVTIGDGSRETVVT